MSYKHISSITGFEYNFSDNFKGPGGVTTDDVVDCDIPELNPKPFPIFPDVNTPAPECCILSPCVSCLGSSLPFNTGSGYFPDDLLEHAEDRSNAGVRESDFHWWVWCAGASTKNSDVAGTWVLAAGDTTEGSFTTPPAIVGKYYGEVVAVYGGNILNNFNVGQTAKIYVEDNVPLSRQRIIDNTNLDNVIWTRDTQDAAGVKEFTSINEDLTLITSEDFCLYEAQKRVKKTQTTPFYLQPHKEPFNVIDIEFVYNIANNETQSAMSLGFFLKQDDAIYALTLDTAVATNSRRYIGSGLTPESFKTIQAKNAKSELDFSRNSGNITFGFFCAIAGDIAKAVELKISNLRLFVGL